jgi:hypothetical protein
MRRLIEYQPRSANRVSQALNASHATCPQVFAIHQESIHLHPAILRQERAFSRIEGLVVFHRGHSRLNRINCRSTSFEQRISSRKRIDNAIFVGGDSVVGHSPGSAVN